MLALSCAQEETSRDLAEPGPDATTLADADLNADVARPQHDGQTPKDTDPSLPELNPEDADTQVDVIPGDTPSAPDTPVADASIDMSTDSPLGEDLPGPAPDPCLRFDTPDQLIADRHFQRGFINIDPATATPRVEMPSGFCPDPPVWQLALGNSRSELQAAQREVLASGAVRWEDTFGRVVLGPRTAPEADLILGVWGDAQYGGTYYVPAASQGWVFHLAQQQISVPGVFDSGSPAISSLDGLDFSVFGRLVSAEQNRGPGYDDSVHAAQYLIYFTVQNQRQDSPGFSDYLWFGVTLYDDRTPVPGLNVLQDIGGTDRLIYNMGAAPFVSEPFTPGGSGMLFEGDILPAIRDALTRAWANGFLTGSNTLSDYRIGGMNIGWEVSGLNDVEMQVRDLSLRTRLRPVAPVVFGFDTDGDREGWTLENGGELTDGPVDGTWLFTVPGATPMLSSPTLTIEASTHPMVRIVIANDHNPADSSVLKVYWDRFGDEGLREAWSRSVAIDNGGGFQTVTLDMGDSPGWVGEIRHLRVDPILHGDGHGVGIDEIAISPR